MTRWLAIIPLVALLGLGGLGAINLLRDDAPTTALSDGRDAPARSFTLMDGRQGELNFSNPPGEQTIIVNLFASWCAPCRVEHPLITQLAANHPDRVYGLLYKDTPENGAAFLTELGDPYTRIGLDPDGQGGLDFGLTGVPETFVIDGSGKIIRHVRGPLDPKTTAEISALLN